jgi:hypothetical protein
MGKLTYEATKGQFIHFDFSDTIKVTQIRNNPWVTFDTRDFSRSVQYEGPDKADNYTSTGGGFSLAYREVAESFAKAVAHAALLCGSRPSTF